MTSSNDRSYRDAKYFVSHDTYNCPFCNRRNIKFYVSDFGAFNWDDKRIVHYYRIKCSDCGHFSFHLSNYRIDTLLNNFKFPYAITVYEKRDPSHGPNSWEILDWTSEDDDNQIELDNLFFYHQPTSFFTVDPRIPKAVREPLSESENCLKNNFLTGASAGLRKAIYKLLQHEKIADRNGDNFLSYDERIKLLSKKYPNVDHDLFCDLEDIQGLTSQELHENNWKDFDAKTLRFLLEVTRHLLDEIFIVPDERKMRRQKVISLKEAAKPQKGKD